TIRITRRVPAGPGALAAPASRGVQRVHAVGVDPLDVGARALDRGDLDLDQQLGPGQSGHATAQRRGMTRSERGRTLPAEPCHLRALTAKSAPPDHFSEHATGPAEGAAYRLVGQVRLCRPVAGRLDLSGEADRRAAADVDGIADRHRPRIAARPFALLLE